MTLPPIWSEPLALGFSVFPCQYLSKKPADKWGAYRTQRVDEATLSTWAATQYNVGTATGELSGVWVLDTDSPAAEAALLALGELPATLSASTPRGRHRYFRYPPGVHIGQRAGVAGVKGIDVRGEGGYVLSPGSFFWPDEKELADGKLPGSYAWEVPPYPDAILPAPEWLLALVTRSNEPPASYGELAAPATATVTSDYGRRALLAECLILRGAGQGRRNEQLNMSAFALSQLVAGGDIVAQEMVDALNAAALEIGLDTEEISVTIGSAWKAGIKQPRKGVSIDPAVAFAASAPVLPEGASPVPISRFKERPPRGATILTMDMDLVFAGCVYVRSMGRVWTPDGDFRSKDTFDTEFGGYTFTLGGERNKPTDSAWEAFRLHKHWTTPQADDVCFRPEAPSGHIIREEGRTLLNTYVPIETRRMAGDVTPFLDFLSTLLPVEGDRAILLAYMASLVQNPGRKFQWWPVIQGTEGNGKTLIMRCLQHAVGKRYTHLPNAPELARNGLKFNGWVQGNLLCGVEEISLGHKRDFLEEFKPIVTNDRVPIERKGVDQVTGDNRLNGILMTNHQDGVPITVDTRRYAVFFTAQQSREDKDRDGMTGRYFANLYGWLQGTGPHAHLGPDGGYAIVAHYLANYAVPAALDPAGECTEAPRTSSFGAALHVSLGRVEQEILEQVEQGLPGFAGGWISSMYVDRLMATLHVTVPRIKRREMMRALGYVPHPALPEGRVNNVINPDGGKPRLYVQRGHSSLELTEASDIARAYSDAQIAAPLAGNVVPIGQARR